MQLTFKYPYFELRCDVVDHALAKRCGFTYVSAEKVWVTPFTDVACKLSKFCDRSTKAVIEKRLQEEHKTRLQSSSVASDFQVPCPEGLSFRPYQKAGIEWIVSRPNSLVGDEMGIGKTIQAIGACNVLNLRKILIICPASLKSNWEKEWKKWSTLGLKVFVVRGDKWNNDADVVIINYDILPKHCEKLRESVWDQMIVDEGQYLKNGKTLRSKHVLGGRLRSKIKTGGIYKSTWQQISPIYAQRKMVLTGTAISNKQIDIYNILKLLDRNAWPDWHAFGMRYCGPTKGFRGWDFLGASNQDELQRKLRSTIMLRRLKKDVLKDLPPKIRQIIEIDPDSKGREIIRTEKHFLKDDKTIDEYTLAADLLDSAYKVAFDQMSKIRKQIGEVKVKPVIEFIEEVISTDKKLIVFGHHIHILEEIHKHFADKSVLLHGKTTQNNRDIAVERFQKDENVKLFVGNIQAAGTGLTLTQASTVVFIESSWVPSEITQAEDRAHRIGQKDCVSVFHFVLKGSLDANMVKLAVKKQAMIDASLNENQEGIIERMLS